MDPNDARRRLEAECAHLESLREKLQVREAETESVGELSSVDRPADLGSETYDLELEVTTLAMVDDQLAEVRYALRRLDEGTYGICEVCGRPIEEARLEAKPAARFCLEDQAKLERRAGQINRAP